jgi:hypothetical protein
VKKDTATHTRATHTTGQPLPTPTDEELRAVAIKRVKAKRDFRGHLYVYLVVNIGLWTIWIIDSVANQWEFPWPIIPTFFWGLFVLGQANDVYRRDPLREDAVQREIEQLRAASKTHPLDTYNLDNDDIC